MPLTSKISLSLLDTLTKAFDGRVASDPITFNKVISLADGVAAGQADNVWMDVRTLAPSTSEDLDLNGSLKNAFGDNFDLAKIKFLLVYAGDITGVQPKNTHNVEVGGETATLLGLVFLKDITDVVVVGPDDLFLLTRKDNGITVGAGTADKLKIANGGGVSSVTYTIIVGGTSA